MFENFPHLLRLLFCLVLSTGLHGGLALYDWGNPAAGINPADVPVAVSLLPAADVTSPEEDYVSPPAPTPVAPTEIPRPEPVQKLIEASRSVKPAAVMAIPKKNDKQMKVAETDKLVRVDTDLLSSETACIPPQSESTDSTRISLQPPQAAADMTEADKVSTEAANKLQSAALHRIEEGLLAGSVSSSQDLVEAVPNYRSNPLPEYPYQARQKHWEGVVWLLVDVSADGSVDDLRVEQSCGHRVLDRTASRAVRRWQFTPAQRAGQAVMSQVRIPVRFYLEDD